MERIENCPLCNNNSFSLHLSCIDYTVTKESFNIQKCDSCGFLLTNPRPDSTQIIKYYDSANYISHTNNNTGLFNKLYQYIRSIALKEKFAIVQSHSKNKELIDYGCGTGEFLSYCISNSYSAIGFEPNASARAHRASKNGLSIEDPKEIYNLEKSKYGTITLWHVLEHVHELNQTLACLTQTLAPEGSMIIAVPNHRSLDATIYKEHWAAYDVPRHLYHFEKSTITTLLKKHGLKLIDTIPMMFDAFYVCLLSEEIQNGKQKPISAILKALASNLLANEEKYSSTIYVFKKINF